MMKHHSRSRYLLVIDRQQHWREFCVDALASADFSVCALDGYDYPPSCDGGQGMPPDLVVLGCASVGPEELKLIRQVLQHKHHLLVLCTSLPLQTMRALFREGVDDVADKPYEPGSLVDIVRQTLESISPRTSYRAVEQEGVS